MGFFAEETITEERPIKVPQCGLCKLHESCNSPKMPVTGDGRKKILVVGEAPGETEDEDNEQFVGKSGQYLREVFEDECGIDLDRDCWKTNAIICRPEDNAIPTDKQIKYCRPNILHTIETLQPERIVMLGQVAVKSVIRSVWTTKVDSITRWAGWKIPSIDMNTWLLPNFHPTYVLRQRNEGSADLWFRNYARRILECEGRPWKTPPDYAAQVKTVTNADSINAWLEKAIASGKPVAFDFENNMLKPDVDESKIAVASVCCGGKRTISFPWLPAVRSTFQQLMRSPQPKYGANIKYEDRWVRREFGHRVRGWKWDITLAAHILDGRDGITSLKFQSLVNLGVSTYDDSVSSYLDADGGYSRNRIHKASKSAVLKYCGMDSLLTYKLAELQMEQLSG